MPTRQQKSQALSTLINNLEEMSPRMGEGPYTHALTTAHEKFLLLDEDEKEEARSFVRDRPELEKLISFP